MNNPIIARDPVVWGKCQAAEESFIADWRKLVNIDSPTGYHEGLAKIRTILLDKLQALGAETILYPSGPDQKDIHLAGTLTGAGAGSILLLAHMDTVLPVGSAVQRPFRIDNEGRAYGPGVSDNKSSILQSLYAMQILRDIGYKDYAKITLFSNCDEENDSPSSKAIVMQLAKEHDYVLCVEGARPNGALVASRAGNGVLEISINGLMAHASAPGEGVNAADEAAHVVVRLNQLADQAKGTILTTRTIEAGTAYRTKSVVPDSATALVRVGAVRLDELERVLAAMRQIEKQPRIAGAKISSHFRLDFPIFPQTDKTVKLAKLAQAIYAGGRSLRR
jgi:Acetylornithine deacetylase/Succinyl-diaminopimelate desuccinylase and related deacylases